MWIEYFSKELDPWAVIRDSVPSMEEYTGVAEINENFIYGFLYNEKK